MKQDFPKLYLVKAGRYVPARLQTALALLEKLREYPILVLTAHLASKGSSGLEGHETWGKKAHQRFGLEPVNKNHGRRSSSLQDWGQGLLDALRTEGFEDASPDHRVEIINEAQARIASILREILEQEPLEGRVRGRSAEAVIAELLRQADEKGKAGDVAQYLVGAKLMLRMKTDLPVHQANKGDRKSRSDAKARAGDFEIGNSVFEVALGLPDEKHLCQIAEALKNADTIVWLLTRTDRAQMWRAELLERLDDADLRRVVVQSVEGFVGQNVAEMGAFSVKGNALQLMMLFKLYNERWIERVGTPGIRIVVK